MMDSPLKQPRIKNPINLHNILDHSVINFNLGELYAKYTANGIGYALDPECYTDPDFARGYAQSMGYIHGINGKEKNWSKSTICGVHDYNSIRSFEHSAIRRKRIMNAVNSKHTFVISDKYKKDYIFGWIYGQYEMRFQHDAYSLEQQGFIYAQSNTELNKSTYNHPKFILGFCAGMGYRDYKNSDNKQIVSDKFDEFDIPKNKCQMYYDMFYINSTQSVKLRFKSDQNRGQ